MSCGSASLPTHSLPTHTLPAHGAVPRLPNCTSDYRPYLQSHVATHIARTHAPRGSWTAWLAQAYERWRQRRALSDLDDHLLKDIGLTREEAMREVRKPFWR